MTLQTPASLTLALLLGLQAILIGAQPAATRPNILFIYTDDQSHDAMSVVQMEQGAKGRYPWLKTPNNVTFATQLRAAGYTTAYIGKWHMGGQRERPGFDHHATYLGHGRYADCPFVVDGKDTKTTGWVDDVATDYAIEFIHNLYNDPSAAALRETLQSEHARLAAEIGYRVLDFVDRPANWGKPGNPAGDPANL